MRETKNESGRGGGRGGRGYGRGRGAGGFNRDYANNENSYGNMGVAGGQGAPEDGESGKHSERRNYGGPRPFRGRRGGFSNGDAGDGDRPRRLFERRSGTGRGLVYCFKYFMLICPVIYDFVYGFLLFMLSLIYMFAEMNSNVKALAVAIGELRLMS